MQLGEALDHLDLVLGLELVNLDRVPELLGYLAELCFNEL